MTSRKILIVDDDTDLSEALIDQLSLYEEFELTHAASATGGIQAMITSSATGTATKAWEYVKNYYDTSAFHPKNAVVVNSRAFSRLSAADQAAIVRVASTAETRGWAMSKVRTLEANELLAKNGMTLHQPDAAMKTAYAKVGAQILDEWLKKSGAEGQSIIKAYRGK